MTALPLLAIAELRPLDSRLGRSLFGGDSFISKLSPSMSTIDRILSHYRRGSRAHFINGMVRRRKEPRLEPAVILCHRRLLHRHDVAGWCTRAGESAGYGKVSARTVRRDVDVHLNQPGRNQAGER